MIFLAPKNVRSQQKFSPSSLGAVVGFGIRYKHHGSATLMLPLLFYILTIQYTAN
jgi:hypothetical protein